LEFIDAAKVGGVCVGGCHNYNGQFWASAEAKEGKRGLKPKLAAGQGRVAKLLLVQLTKTGKYI
jgi:hypothetical protein